MDLLKTVLSPPIRTLHRRGKERLLLAVLCLSVFVIASCASGKVRETGPAPEESAQAGNSDAPGVSETRPPKEEPTRAGDAGALGGVSEASPAPEAAAQPGNSAVQEEPSEPGLDEDFLGEDFFDEELEEEIRVYDPLEPFNRTMFWVNDKLYFYIFKPVARVVRIVPEPARESVSNFFTHLATPVRFVNSLLQFKFKDASVEASRFVVNTTVGVGGLFDVARKEGYPAKEEDFGQTLGVYGLGPGVYIVWPVIGPSTLRDTAGLAADSFLDLVPYITDDFGVYVGVEALDRVNELSLDKDTYEGVKRDALDPYLFIRNAYMQNRKGIIAK